MKVTGISIGKGFQGTIKRHNFSRGPVTHGSHNVRKPGSIGASATPSRVFKGMKMAGQMGGKRVTQVGLTVVDRDAEQNLLLVKGAVPGPRTATSSCGRTTLMAAPKAPVLDASGKKSKDVTLDRGRVRAPRSSRTSSTRRCAPSCRGALRHARGEEPRARLGRTREAVAPEGHRPRPRGHDPRARS